ncbi:MAG: type II toxin-antitoxin system VapC family toxin [Promethearchaeota archaeon]
MILADSTLVIDLLRQRHGVKDILKQYQQTSLAISLISIAELYTGLHYTQKKLGNKIFEQKKKELESTLAQFEILELNADIMILAGKIRAQRLLEGIPIDSSDLIIGATGFFFHATGIMTRNTPHFECWQIPIIKY